MASRMNVGEGRGEAAIAVERAEPPTVYFPSCGVLCDAFWWARRRRAAANPGAGANGVLPTIPPAYRFAATARVNSAVVAPPPWSGVSARPAA